MGGNQFTISGEVTLKTAQAAQGAKQVRSEIEGLAKSGIAGFEAAQGKVIDLTKRLGELRNELLKTNDPARQAQLNAALAQTQREFKAARTEMRGMSLQAGEANEKVMMLAASLGVQVPQGMGRILARMPAIQSGIEHAFSAVIVFAFVRAIAEAATNWEKFQGAIGAALGPISAAEVKLFNLVGLLKDYSGAAGEAAEAQKQLTEAEEALSKRVLEARLKANEAGKKGIELWTEESNNRIKLLQREQGAADQSLRSQFDNLILIEKESLARKAQAQVFDEDAAAKEKAAQATTALAEKEGIAARAAENLAEKQARANEQFAKSPWFSLQGAGSFEEWQTRTEALMQAKIDADEAVRKAGLKTINEIVDADVDATQMQIELAQKAREAQEHALTATAEKIESFIDRVFLTARSLSDVFHQFLTQLLGSFVKWVSQMIAEWLRGAKQLSTGQATGGGILGSILRGMFGFGSAGEGTAAASFGGLPLPGGGVIQGVTGGVSAGAITPFGGGSEMTTLVGAGGNVLVGAGIPKVAGGAGGMAALTSLATGGLLLGGAAGLSRAWTAGGPITGALAGAGIGLGLGFLATGAFFGPIGLAIAGIAAGIGALIGMFGRGKAKRKATAIEVPYEQAAAELFDQYKQHELDFESAVGGLEALIAQGQQAELSAGLGKWGRKGSENLTRIIEDLIRAVQNLEKQRQINAAIIGGITIPEFALGGPVGFRMPGGGIFAIVHPGEFVMRRDAVDALGTNFLAALNRAPRFDVGGTVGGQGGRFGAGSVVIGNLNIFGTAGETPHAFANRVVATVRRAKADGAL